MSSWPNYRDPSGHSPYDYTGPGPADTQEWLYWITGDESYHFRSEQYRKLEQEVEYGSASTAAGMLDSLLSHIGRAGIEIYNACVMLGNLYAESEVQRHNVYYGDSYGRVEYQPIAALPADMADNYLERQASSAWDMDRYYMGRCGGDAVLMTAEIGMLAKGAVDATLAVYDGLKAAVGIGSAGGGFRLVSLAGGGQTVLAPAGVAVAEGTVEGILGGVAEGSLSGFGFHTINDFLDNLAKIDADRVFGGEGGSAVRGTLTGKLNDLTAAEKTMVNDLLNAGNDVEVIPRSNIPGQKTPDFLVNGVKTELKTLTGTSLNTPVTRIQDGFKQGAETVIIDGRNTGLTVDNANTVIERALGKYGGELPGTVEIWTTEGIIRR